MEELAEELGLKGDEFDVWRHEFANVLKFSNTSLPTLVCRVKAALHGPHFF